MSEQTKERLRDPTFWKRLLYMALFAIVHNVVKIILTVAILFQVIINLFTGKSNDRLLVFSKHLSSYIYSILLYLTFNTEQRPFPFSDWPSNNTVNEGVQHLSEN